MSWIFWDRDTESEILVTSLPPKLSSKVFIPASSGEYLESVKICDAESIHGTCHWFTGKAIDCVNVHALITLSQKHQHATLHQRVITASLRGRFVSDAAIDGKKRRRGERKRKQFPLSLVIAWCTVIALCSRRSSPLAANREERDDGRGPPNCQSLCEYYEAI